MGRGAARGGARALVATEMKAVVSSCRSARSCFPAFPPAAGASPLRATSSCSRFTCRSIASRSACKSAALPHRPAASGRIPRELAPGRSRAPVFSNNFHGVEQLSRSCSNASRSLRGISLGHVRPTCTGRGRDVRPICTGGEPQGVESGSKRPHGGRAPTFTRATAASTWSDGRSNCPPAPRANQHPGEGRATDLLNPHGVSDRLRYPFLSIVLDMLIK